MRFRLKRYISFIIAALIISTSLNIQSVNSVPQFATVSYVEAKSTKSQTVYITKTGSKYHKSTCRTLKKSKIKVTLKQAKADGNEPCKVCKPTK